MPLNSALVSSASSDLVAVLDSDFNQVFPGARPFKVTVREAAKVMEHPIETGATITDFRIIVPIEGEFSLIIPGPNYRSVYAEIKQYFLNATLLILQTKATSHENMLIAEMPREEDPDMYDAISMSIRFKEAQFVTAQFGRLPASKVQNKSQASTVDRGSISGTSPTDPTKSSILYGTFLSP